MGGRFKFVGSYIGPMRSSTLAFLVVIVILLTFWYNRRCVDLVTATADGQQYAVVTSYANSAEASNILAKANANVIIFLAFLKKKYSGGRGERSRVVDAILQNYNYEAIEENDPKYSGSETSFTINKGEKMVLCLREKKAPYKFCDGQTLLFCILHELSHIGNVDEWGHERKFWIIFKFILSEASTYGIYSPVDYERHPKVYCGLKIDYNPLFDLTLPVLPIYPVPTPLLSRS